jgi:N6-L-threonylcarbamoyladenine synthase
MRILGIESSCDETAAAVVKDGARLISNVVHSQIDLHAAFGGVIPEVAARSHLEVVLPVIDRAVSEAGGWDSVDAIAATTMPGLVGSLLIGSLSARTLALIKNKPFYPVHHVEAHVYANFIEAKTSPKFPILALIVSGGHSQIVLFHNHGDYTLIGQTADDAVGEAFDKVAKILGLPYPGGPSIAQVAQRGDALKYKFPKAKMTNKYDFSFSGLKTAVLRRAQSEVGKDHTFPSSSLSELLNDAQRNNFAASFQRVAVDTLVDKVIAAYNEFQPKSVVIAGGVAASQELRRALTERLPIDIEFPPTEFCTDNAAMVASLGYFMAQKIPPTDPRDVEIQPSISMSKTMWSQSTTRYNASSVSID